MSAEIDAKLASMGIVLPAAAAPAANYVPYMQTGNLLYISGQLPLDAGKLAVTGQLGAGVHTPEGQRAAELCAINILTQAQAALGDLGRITRVVKITVLVSSTPDFYEHHLVANGASNLLANDLLGDAGKHARAAVGMAALPLNAAVEIDAVIEVA